MDPKQKLKRKSSQQAKNHVKNTSLKHSVGSLTVDSEDKSNSDQTIVDKTSFPIDRCVYIEPIKQSYVLKNKQCNETISSGICIKRYCNTYSKIKF